MEEINMAGGQGRLEEVASRTIIVIANGFFCVKEINKKGSYEKNKEESKTEVLSLFVSFNHSLILFNIIKSNESQM